MRVDLRQLILDRLEQTGMSRYELGIELERLKVYTPNSLYRYLRGDADASGAAIGAMLEVLGLEVRCVDR